MGAPKASSHDVMPEKNFDERILKKCTSRKRDNIVLIEVDSDDFGDVIILDVPDSFQKKFRKRAKLVINIDDEDGGGSSDGVCHTNSDATTSDQCFPTEAADPSTTSYDVNGEDTPVKLSKSKRTYPGKSIPRNHCGISLDSESCSSESDSSDCVLMEGSSGKLREHWEKASFRRRQDASCAPHDFENEAGTSVPSHPVHDYAEDAEPPVQQSNVRKCSVQQDGDNVFAGYPEKFSEESKASDQDYDPMEIDGHVNSSSDEKERGGTLSPESPVHHNTEEPAGDFRDSTGKLAEELKFPRPDYGDMTKNEVCSVYSTSITKGPSEDVESDHAALIDRQQGVEIVCMLPDHELGCGNQVVSSSDQINIIIDRQKIKETEEYKHAMEEELAARQQQLLIQAEEARRLRNRKKAENMRIQMNERRQKERVEEIRQTRRRDEENLNLKEKHRSEIKMELRRTEAICSDMASLLRCLGIHVGGGQYPPPNEVQAAYKRACLKFHPDRMSTTCLRQQVEAEEKFKLISNMKDKFLQNR
ncbi:uncharacterized protein [Spinacia oleracea]|uniref:J domain-containing protein n=1 Tax=Spinacia oleracea TaxID=3562 RepID=A0A9R0JIY5_SPIOL|nr:uncharacterized protein LOC110806175 [Spinacia oleracea]